jgi:prepilin-type N-terminal cleavage/methylation domain-containing protein
MNKSFTLIEILVAIVVIGVLSAFILVGMSSVSNVANVAKSKTFSNSIRNSLLMNIVSEWKFDEGTGTAANDSWGIYPAALTDTWEAGYEIPTWATNQKECVSGSCLEYSGNAGNVTINNVNAFKFSGGDQELSISVWAKTDTAESTGQIISKAWNGNGQYNYWIKWQSDNYANVVLLGATSFSAITAHKLSKDVWNHYFLSLSSIREVKLYVNTISEINTTHSITNWTPSSGDTNRTLTIGNIYPAQDGAQYIFDGKIDEVVLYDKAMPTSVINQEYYSGINKLFKNNGATLNEFNQRIVELKTNLVSE